MRFNPPPVGTPPNEWRPSQSTGSARDHDAKPMLCLTLLGRMRACDADGEDVLPRLRKARALLAILAFAAPRPVLRSRLIGLLWSRSDRSHALASLRMAAYELKAALGPAARLLRTRRMDVALGDTGLRIDTRRVVSAGFAGPDSRLLQAGTFLADLVGLDPGFDRWLSEQQQDLARKVRAAAAASLARAHGPTETAAAAERFQVDPSPQTATRMDDLCTALISPRDAPSGHHVSRPRVCLGVGQVSGDGDARAADWAAALTEELIAALSCFRWLDCVPRTALHAGDDSDFLLTGAVRRHGDRLRVSLHLVDQRAASIVVWAEHYDHDIGDVVVPWVQIAGTTAARIESRLWLGRTRRVGADDAATHSPRELVHLAAPMVHRLDRDGFMIAGRWLRRAVELDPNDASAHAWFVQWCLYYIGQGWAADAAAGLQRARALAARTIQLDPEDARGLTLAGHVLAFLDRRPEEALRLHERAIPANQNLPLSWCLSGLAESYLGNSTEGIRRIRHAQALSPGDPLDYFNEMALCVSNLLSGEYEVAAVAGQRAIALNSGFSSSHKCYLAAKTPRHPRSRPC
jgi:TolB-like protein